MNVVGVLSRTSRIGVVLFLGAFSCQKDKSAVEATNPIHPEPLIDWKALPNAPQKCAASFIKDSQGFFYVGSDGIILRSTDEGENWTTIQSRTTPNFITLNPFNDNIFAAYGGGLFSGALSYTTDSGNSWQDLNNFPSGTTPLSIEFVKNDSLFVGSFAHDESTGGIFFSNDYGTTWTSLSFFSSSMSIIAIYLTHNNSLLASSGDRQIFKSTDLGQTWLEVDSNGMRNAARMFRTNSEENIFTGTWGDGVYMSENDGEAWVFRGLEGHRIVDLLIDGNDIIIALSNDFRSDKNDGVYYSTDSGLHWSRVNSDTPIINGEVMLIDNYGYIYVGTNNHGMFRSSEPSSIFLGM